MALTYIWKAGTSSKWGFDGWGKALPTKKDTAVLTSTPGSSHYNVTIAADESISVDTLDIAADYARGGMITLTIDGIMTLNTLEYDPNTVLPSKIFVNQGGIFTIGKAITDNTHVAETLRLVGGTLMLDSNKTDLSNFTIDFCGCSGGFLDFDYNTLKTVQMKVTGFTAGDKIFLSNTDLTGDTYTYDPYCGILSIYNGKKIVFQIGLYGNQTQFTLTDNCISGGVVCYAAGTYLATPGGEERVENLQVGDLVVTVCDGRQIAQPVKWIGNRMLDLARHPECDKVSPIRIRTGAFSDNVPHRDLLVSPDHAIFVDGKLICARQLVNYMTIVPETGLSTVTYYHVELESHAILLAEGLPAESYLNTGNDSFFANGDRVVSLYPDLADESNCPTREAGSVVPFVWDEGNVRPIWETLAQRGVMLGNRRPHLNGTTDAQVRVEANGQVLRPNQVDNGAATFVIPAGTQFVRLLSHADAPTSAKPWLEDRRILGIYVQRITLRDLSTDEFWDIPLDQPNLSQGWYDVERDGRAQRRWTNGNAVVPLPNTDGMMLLTLHADTGGITYLTTEHHRVAA